ncbi:MAG TPA: tetratricopeptide repeat protein [Acidimicrobiales bacterium]|nr:tetratricopeptide repeat protein [Acidimicrobiales bacterium]
MAAAGDEGSLRQALELEPANEKAVLGLASLLVEKGGASNRDEALALLARIPETADSRRIAALARVGEEVGADGGDVEAKLDALLEQVKSDEEARQEFLDLLEVLGPEDPRTPRYRKALTARLF